MANINTKGKYYKDEYSIGDVKSLP
jgi:hypothetical protein